MPKVSVVIPTYNRKNWLQEAIDSVRRQTFQDLEILVADDGSTDGTAETIQRSYGNAVRHLALPHTGLPATGRNAGMKAARGEYVAFLDSDDLWLPHKLELQIKALESHPHFGWSYGKAVRFGENGQEERAPEVGWWQLHSGNVFRNLLQNNFIPTCTVVARKRCLEAIGEFDQTPALRSAEDYEFWIRMSARFPLHASRETLARYRVTKDNISKDLSARFAIEKLALELAGQKLQIPEPLMQKALAGLHLRLFRYTIDADPQKAMEHLRSSWELNPRIFRTALYRLMAACAGATGARQWIRIEKWLKRKLG